MSHLKHDSFENGAGRTKEQTKQLKRVFKKMRVIDAKGKMIIAVKPIDGEGATSFDATQCVFARACQRMFDSQAAVFFSRTVYIDMPDEDDERKVFRFVATERTYNAIREYDRTGTFRPGTYILNPPSPSQKLDVQRATSAERRKRPEERQKKIESQRRRARILAEGREVKTPRKAGVQTNLGKIRSGSGLVHTTIIHE